MSELLGFVSNISRLAFSFIPPAITFLLIPFLAIVIIINVIRRL